MFYYTLITKGLKLTFCASCGDCMSAPNGETGEFRDITLNGDEISRIDIPGLAAPPGLLL